MESSFSQYCRVLSIQGLVVGRSEVNSSMSYEQTLKDLGYDIQPVELDNGKFVQAVRTGNLMFTAGNVSSWQGDKIIGKVGREVSVEEGYQAARYSALNCLRAIKTLTGDLDKVTRIVKVLGMVNVAPDFNNTPAVIHGCSDLLREVFGGGGFARPQRCWHDVAVRLCYRNRNDR